MVQCPVCRVTYVANTLFCTECGLYLRESEALGTDPLENGQVQWLGQGEHIHIPEAELLEPEPPTVRLRVGVATSNGKADGPTRELQVALTKPIRIGRMDPGEDIYPEVDLTEDLAMEQGVSREHACIFLRGDAIEIQDLGSTNGTLLNGERLDPYIPEPLKDGDQLQLGRLLIEICFDTQRRPGCVASSPPGQYPPAQPQHPGPDQPD